MQKTKENWICPPEKEAFSVVGLGWAGATKRIGGEHTYSSETGKDMGLALVRYLPYLTE